MSGRVRRMMPFWLFPAFLKTGECMQPSFTLVWMEKGSINWLRRLPALSSGSRASWRYSLFKMVFRSVVGCVFTSPCISFWIGLPPYLIMLSIYQLFHPIHLLLYPFFFLLNLKISSSDSLTVEGNFWSRVLPIFLESLEAVSEIKLKCCLGLRNFDLADSPRSVFPIHGFVELDGQCYQQQPVVAANTCSSLRLHI